MGDETSHKQLTTPHAERSEQRIGLSSVAGRDFYEAVLKELERGQAIAVATVVAVHGSASARTGSKAIISQEGRNVFGWVGGGCAESFVIQHAQQAIQTGVPRMISVDLNDEVFGVGMPCGGNIAVYIDPLMPPKRLLILRNDPTARWLAEWAKKIGFAVLPQAEFSGLDAADYIGAADYVVVSPHDEAGAMVLREHAGLVTSGLPIHARTAAEEAISLAAWLLGLDTSRSGQPLWRVKHIPAEFRPRGMPGPRRSQLVLVGHNRITESLAQLAVSLDWQVTVNSVGASAGDYPPPVCRILNDDAYELDDVGAGSYVVIATQHKGDHLVLRNILTRAPAYIGLIASSTRAALVMQDLKSQGMLELARGCVHAPCGMDLGARSPFEIALAICCELIEHRNNSSA